MIMLKAFSILLSNLILLQSLNIGLDDFSKINVLIKHVQYHQENYGDSFFDFLAEHYGSNEYKTTNHKEHKDLPFKQDSFSQNHLPSIFALQIQIFELQQNIIVQIQQNYHYKESDSFFEKPTIFQPPKLA
jgi:hypothetical protein